MFWILNFQIFVILFSQISCGPIESVVDNNRFEYKGLFWQDEIIYQIYPRSFKDSDGDGIGDLAGITSKSDYIKESGIGIIWISPIYKSPMKDFGYDISDYRMIDPMFGTMEDFDALIKEYHSKDIKVLMDFVPNHTSDEHEWFIKSVKKDPMYEDFYVWVDPLSTDAEGKPVPPNDWLSSFRNSAWQWNDDRKQFYYHQFLKEQPDLNYRNPKVVEAMKDVLRFWMDKGVDGFRLDAISGLVEVEDVVQNDEPKANPSTVTDPTEYEYLNHTKTLDLPETYDVIRGWKEVCDSYDNKVIIGEVYDKNITLAMGYYGNNSNPVSDFPFNFYFIMKLKSRDDVTGTNLKSIINLWLENMPEGRWPNWVLGNHDRQRVGSRLGVDMIDSLNMMTLLLPGTAVTYYGEEIGMIDTNISYADAKDPWGCNFGPERYAEFGRDPERTPMQWDESAFAGFTEGTKTWLPVNENFKELNVKTEQSADQSSWKLYSNLATLRKKPVFRQGKITFLASTNDDTLAFMRSMEDSVSYIVVINTAKEMKTINLKEAGDRDLPEEGTVVLKSSHDMREETNPGKMLPLSSIEMEGGEGMVLMVVA